MRNQVIYVILFLSTLISCSALKKTPQPDYSQYIFEAKDSVNIATTNDSTKTSDEMVVKEEGAIPNKTVNSEEELRLKKKYAALLKTSPDKIKDMNLFAFIDEWLHTPYLWAGTTKNGIDCSALIQKLFSDVYKIRIPRTSVQQFFTQNVERFSGKPALAKGDLIFFRTLPGTYVSHVGMYLDNNMFVNSSSSKGVSIANLNDPYWASKYVGAGRLIVDKSVRVED